MTLRQPSAAARLPIAAGDPLSERVERARRGDQIAREELATWCRRAAYLLALQLLRDPEDALDVAQDSALRFFSNLHRFEPGRAVKPWLFAIVRNRVRDLKRWRRVRLHEPLDGLTGEDRPEIVDLSPGPEGTAEQRQLQARLWQAVNQLTDGQREILILRDYQDLSYQEIARVLSIPQGTVMSRLHRARKALRSTLSDLDEAGEISMSGGM
ncbi:MAG: sigma-70 family RNA polymerase sigma factor [Acidobacteriota bacterium]